MLLGSLLGSLLPHEPVIEPTITIRHQGRAYNAWMLDKRDDGPNGELQRVPAQTACACHFDETRNSIAPVIRAFLRGRRPSGNQA